MTKSRSMLVLWSLTLTLTLLVQDAQGHGRLIDPPARSSMWRFGFNTPIESDDNGLNCGGMWHQWGERDGRCGLCGDKVDFPQPRPHENGGKYGQGVIARQYSAGQTIDVKVEITAAHGGWFEFRLCCLADRSRHETQECLDEHVLLQPNGERRVPVSLTRLMVYTIQLVLPEGLECEQAVFQWKYHGGNNYGCGGPGYTNCGKGKGNMQEEFYGCSDITIGTGTAVSNQNRNPDPPAQPEAELNWIDNSDAMLKGDRVAQCVAVERLGVDNIQVDDWCKLGCFKLGACPADVCRCFIIE